MPLLKIQTNANPAPEAVQSLLAEGTELIVTKLDKPKEYVQVMLETSCAVSFAGSDEPNAFVELRALGLPSEKPNELSGAICTLLQDTLGIRPERVFINFFDMPRDKWGWNSATFG